MNTKLPKIQPETDTRQLIYNPVISHQTVQLAQIMRVELDDNFTRIDFVYYAEPKYANGGWINIHATCYIQPVDTKLELRMVRAVNIPVAPKRHEFKSVKDCLYYTLYFPALPAGTRNIDIIEKNTSDPTFFNFYGVSVERIRREIINVSN